MLRYCGQNYTKIKASLALFVAIITIQSCGTSGLRQDAASLPKTTTYEQPLLDIEESLQENAVGFNAVNEDKIRDIQPNTPNTKIIVPDPKVTTHYVHELIGMETGAIYSILGKPSLIRKEEPARILQYVVRECVLDIYLYEDGSADKKITVIYYEMRNANGKIIRDNACFMNIVSAHYNMSHKVHDQPS